MDSNLLKQYKSLIKEFAAEERRIDILDEKIKSLTPNYEPVTDVVTKGKRGKKPLGLCVIRGNEDSTIVRHRANLRKRKAQQEFRLSEIENMIIDVEDYINNVPDSEARMMMRYFFIDDMSWTDVAAAMGNGYTADACKKKVQRILSKT